MFLFFLGCKYIPYNFVFKNFEFLLCSDSNIRDGLHDIMTRLQAGLRRKRKWTLPRARVLSLLYHDDTVSWSHPAYEVSTGVS